MSETENSFKPNFLRVFLHIPIPSTDNFLFPSFLLPLQANMDGLLAQRGGQGDDSHLPRILCLHGGGTSATIFKIQVRRLLYALRDHFKFVFVSAPYESGPGPGVMPVFAGCDPFYRWMFPEGENQAPGQIEVRETLKEAIAQDGGEFVGVLGFSQGARMSAGLLADQHNGDNEGMPKFKFGVLCCGAHPPMSLAYSQKPYKPVNPDQWGEVRELEPDEIIHIPTVHVTGLQDVHLERGRRLAKYFDNKIHLEYDMGHHMPGAAGDTTSPKGATTEIAEAILKQFGADVNLKANGIETPTEPDIAPAVRG